MVNLSVLSFSKQLFLRIKEHQVTDLAAQLAYYFLLSLFPFLIFAITLLAHFDFSKDQILELIAQYAPSESFVTIQENLILEDGARKGLLSFGIIATIWSASNAINAIIKSLNRAYNVDESRNFLLARGLSVLLSLAMIFVIVVALLLPVFGEMLWRFFVGFFAIPESFSFMFTLIRWFLSLSIMIIVFMFIYYYAPNKRLHYKDVMIGSVTASVLWQLVSFVFSYYINNFGNYSATYGSLGGVIALMLWFYLTGLVIVVGGEINATSNYFRRNKPT
ncbi:YihY/virulence factor BrkB family protein [Guptibacillus algicola]|uniref:YihY/virulence factor BrkB family protein n=1 Tax=Guptibacillus algicola TaxID=225844 RepID=UPI001CD27381|nr:YihY/virulence factor BrkB family protein [Alkalihalobacillus algicola]MCA0989348.1 YihY/virulence factor BrkB family protein [Alkalihalobacillus algicola]